MRVWGTGYILTYTCNGQQSNEGTDTSLQMVATSWCWQSLLCYLFRYMLLIIVNYSPHSLLYWRSARIIFFPSQLLFLSFEPVFVTPAVNNLIAQPCRFDPRLLFSCNEMLVFCNRLLLFFPQRQFLWSAHWLPVDSSTFYQKDSRSLAAFLVNSPTWSDIWKNSTLWIIFFSVATDYPGDLQHCA